jgi:integrase
MPANPSRNEKSRIRFFQAYQDSQGRPWHTPDFAGWRDNLLARGLKLSSVKSYLGTVRGAYRSMDQNALRTVLYSMAPADASAADRKALVDEVVTRLENAINPEQCLVKTHTAQEKPDAAQVRLTKAQASALMQAPGVGTIKGLRDTALIALMLCTGIRQGEASALDVGDLRQSVGGELALHVRKGKGDKSRLIPYGALDFCLAIVDRWLEAAGIEDGPVFRGLYKGGALRPGRLSVRAIEYIVGAYPVAVDGDVVTVRPHDLRRTYARRLYEAGVALIAIQQNLGHASSKTTEKYIGVLDADTRRPPAIYSFDLGTLAGAPERLPGG